MEALAKHQRRGVVKGCLEEPWAKFGMIYVIVWRFTVFLNIFDNASVRLRICL